MLLFRASGRSARTVLRTFAMRRSCSSGTDEAGCLHITPVTAEPMPTRLASLARGTAEVDALYHVALDELSAGVRASDARGADRGAGRVRHAPSAEGTCRS